ncbi:putative dormancy-associated protein [Cardamine amara subsp. amara]|uniref:Dormancy-associated protein n=1 Tax=Cardamine amara subsp. amara TaxID=228776 RepID=A0ABD1B8T7_CARAN
MGVLENLWDDVVAGPRPEAGDRSRGHLRRISTGLTSLNNAAEGMTTGSVSLPASPATPATPVTPRSGRKVDVWRSVFHPASNVTTRDIGANVFDKPSHPNSPTVYDWMYSNESRSKHR